MEMIITVIFALLAGALALCAALWLLAYALIGLGSFFEALVRLVTGKSLDSHLGRDNS